MELKESVSAFQAERRAFESRLPLHPSLEQNMIDLHAATTDELITLAKGDFSPALEELYCRAQQKYAHLSQQPITVREAADQYYTDSQFWRNAIQAKRVRVLKQGGLGPGNSAEMDAADVGTFMELYINLRGLGYLLNKVYRVSKQTIAA